MQTIPVNPKLANQAMHHAPVTHIQPLPPVALIPGLMPGTEPKPTPTAGQQIAINPHAELDAMLSRDPNVGAVHGLRFAMLFNAGLALSGLMAWELWSLLAS